PGATVSIGQPTFGPGASHIVMQGFTLDGSFINGATHISMIHDTFTRGSKICPVQGGCATSGTVLPAYVLYDYDRFDNITSDGCCDEGRIDVWSPNNGDNSPTQVT